MASRAVPDRVLELLKGDLAGPEAPLLCADDLGGMGSVLTLPGPLRRG